MRIVVDARRSLKKHRVDQWQGVYPEWVDFEPDLERGECFVLLHGGEIAGVFTLTTLPQPCYDEITDGKWTADMPYCGCTAAPLRRNTAAAAWRST